MKKFIYILAALSIAPTFAIAQSLESDVDAELDQMYSSAQAAPAQAAAPAAAAPAAPAAGVVSTAPVSGQPIYILNQATPTSTATSQAQQTAVQKQPTTIIEASPLTESRAEQIRRARQDAELATEQRIVEKLETSRMEDEKKRANVLFGDKFNSLNEQPQVQQPVQQAAPIVIQQVPVQKVEEPKENTRDIIREELAAAALKTKEEEVQPEPVETKYVAGILGVGDYPDTNNVKGQYAMGVAFGSKFDNIVIEGAFLYSNYRLTPRTGYYGGYGYSYGGYYVPNEIDINQYSGQLAAKVQLFDAIIKPVFGGLVSYSYREQKWANDGYGVPNNSAKSHAIDVGALVGADLEFNPKYSLGLDFRYMWNLSNRLDAPAGSIMDSPYYTKVEKLQYYVLSLVGRVNF
ncbi:hypothetical protein [Bdellovibrio sp. HCB2-146]|uniref:hypothetical protein n=1 Tax=Bdellovibrio sp. HCB2-146 TaxID=3394362 RepID=UPI0039BCE5FD